MMQNKVGVICSHILRNVVCYERGGGWLVSPSKCQNQDQLILDCEVILTLELNFFKVWHIGCSDILDFFFSYLCFYVHYFLIYFIRYFEIMQEWNHNPKFWLDLIILVRI